MTLRSWIAFVALCVIWGIPYFFIKLALEGFSPAWVACGRLALGASVLLPIAWQRGMLRPVLAHKRAVVAFALVELVGPFLLIAVGERYISSSLTGILIAAVPLAVIVLSPLFGLDARLGTRRLSGLLLGFIGVVALLGLDLRNEPSQWIGVGCVAISMLGYAAGSLIVQRHLHAVDELGAVAVSLAVSTIVLLPVALLSNPIAQPSFEAWMAMFVLGAVCTAFGLLLYVYLIGAAGAARATVVTYINPALAALLGVLLLDEHFGLGSILGLILILCGSWLATSGQTAPTESRPKELSSYRGLSN